MGTSWYYAQDQQQQGPFSVEQMRQMISSGALRGNDLVWSEGDD
jgi:hypothetical protein